MPRVSAKANKNVYFQRREELGLTRDKASELLESIPSERIEKIENERSEPHPEENLCRESGREWAFVCRAAGS